MIFYLNGSGEINNSKFGLLSRNWVSAVNAVKEFKKDLVQIMNKVSFRKVNDPFPKNITNDINKANAYDSVFIFTDK